MKVQVTAHVNYEVDYKKLAEALAAKLETMGKHVFLFFYSIVLNITLINLFN